MAKTFVWVAFTNEDLVEGKGADIPHSVSQIEATAIRKARYIYAQGANGPVKKFEVVDVAGVPHVPLECVRVFPPLPEDWPEQAKLDTDEAENNAVGSQCESDGEADEQEYDHESEDDRRHVGNEEFGDHD